MIKKTIEISRQPVHLSASLDQLILQPFGEDKAATRSIPCEDIGVLLIDEPRCSITQGALETLLRFGASVVVCGRDHLPAGLLLPVSSHTEQVQRLDDQINATKPTRKRLWKQVVQAKIRNHATLHADHPTAARKLQTLSREVKSGDETNVEGQAARVHWSAWRDRSGNLKDFKRDPDGEDGHNGLLNYGYAVLRAAVARALVASGLHPALGLHHRHRANAFCLADDLVEPLRPLADGRVAEMIEDGQQGIDRDAKASLLHLLTAPVKLDNETGPLMVALPRITASLVRCYRNETRDLLLPSLETTDAT